MLLCVSLTPTWASDDVERTTSSAIASNASLGQDTRSVKETIVFLRCTALSSCTHVYTTGQQVPAPGRLKLS